MRSFQKRTRPCLLIITVIFLFAVYADLSGLYDIAERKTIDLRTRLIRKDVSLPSEIAVIVIDEATLNYVNYIAGRWPWPRRIHADLIDALKQWGARDIVMDVLFTEKQVDGSDTGDLSGPDELGRDDRRLTAATAAAGNVTHAFQLMKDRPDKYNREQLNRDLPDDFPDKFALNVNASGDAGGYNNFSLPFRQLYRAAAGVGVVTFDNDADGVFRSERLLFDYRGNYLPGLSLSPLLNRYQNQPITLTDRCLELDDLTIPLQDGEYYINMYGRYKDNVYSYGGVLVTIGKLNQGMLGDLPVRPEEFTGRTVFIGAAAAGVKDLKHTAIATRTPAVYLHASIFGNIVTRDFLDFVPRPLSLMAVFILIVLTVVPIFYIKNIFGQVLIPLAAVCLYLLTAYKLFASNTVVMTANPLFSFFGAYLLSFTYIGLTEGRNRRRIKNILGQYVSPNMLNQVLEHHKEDYFKAEVGSREELTLFFSDIRGFTTISEKLKEEQVVEMLNAYLSAMVNIIFDNEGTLDKFIGDAVVAFWGAPLRHEDDPLRAVKSALEMMAALEDLNRHNRKNNLPELAIGIGIHTGSVILGNIGSEKKLDYTVIGDNVNLTSRLEGLTKSYQSGILISGETYELVKGRMLCRLVDYVVVKGKQTPILIYSVLGYITGADPQILKIISFSHDAFEHYRHGRFNEAIDVYEKILNIRPDDFLADLFIKRCRMYLNEPPPAGWEGAFVRTTK